MEAGSYERFLEWKRAQGMGPHRAGPDSPQQLASYANGYPTTPTPAQLAFQAATTGPGGGANADATWQAGLASAGINPAQTIRGETIPQGRDFNGMFLRSQIYNNGGGNNAAITGSGGGSSAPVGAAPRRGSTDLAVQGMPPGTPTNTTPGAANPLPEAKLPGTGTLSTTGTVNYTNPAAAPGSMLGGMLNNVPFDFSEDERKRREATYRYNPQLG